MHPAPRLPSLAEAPEGLFASGHLWLLEWLDGRRLRFAVDDAGVVRFASGPDRFEPWAEPPVFAHAADHVREQFDGRTFLDAVDGPDDHVFVGVATVANGVDYDLERAPSFVGYEVWDGDAFLPPDRAERAFERLGLAAAPTFDREVDARFFDPETYEVPTGAWTDGPAYGVLVRNKTGERALALHPSHDRAEGLVSTVPAADAPALAERLATDERIDAAGATVGGQDVGAVTDRLVADLVREHAPLLVHGPAGDRPDFDAFRSAVAEHVARRLG